LADLDDIDRRLLALLQANGRLGYAELGKDVGLAVSTVNERVKKLFERGVVSGVHARASAPALGLNLLAFVFVGWNDPETEARFLKKVSGEPAILECHHVTGDWNYLIKVRTYTTGDLEVFLGEFVKTVPGVQRTQTLIVLSSPKETMALPAGPPPWKPA
jgi:Lrp/AsnC family leucine-responsive transcriptional regulator